MSSSSTSTEETKPGTMEYNPDNPDAAEFLLSNSKYHDRHLIVGNPVSDKVERIGVSSTHLIAHSLVFRQMLTDSKPDDTSSSNIHITDVSPATFKLLLRHIYGGILPKLNDEEMMNLALLGARYKMQFLVDKAAEQLKPTSAEAIFPALIFVTYTACPNLELKVGEIIQNEVHKIVSNNRFLELEEDTLVIIVKQDKLSITELQLWDHLVRWGENQVKKCPEKTLRDCLNKVLEYFRVLTLTVEDIVKHLLPTKVLTPEEFVDLTSAVANNESLKSPGLCKNKEKRRCFFKSAFYFELKNISLLKKYNLKKRSSKLFSNFSIEPNTTVKIDSFTIQNLEFVPNGKCNYVYKLVCYIDVTKSLKGIPVERNEVKIEQSAVLHEDVTLHIKLKDGEPLILTRPGKYTFNLEFNTPHTVYEIYQTENVPAPQEAKQVDKTFDVYNDAYNHTKVKYEDYPHVIGIAYETP